jgi:hypothetical protein
MMPVVQEATSGAAIAFSAESAKSWFAQEVSRAYAED